MNKPTYFEKLTDDLITLIEKNPDLNWVKQWTNKAYTNPFSGTKYKGTNYVRLMLDCALNERSTGNYCTFNQAKSNDLKVKKGAKSVQIVYYTNYKVEEKSNDETEEKNRTILRYSNVFNFEELEGDKSKWEIEKPSTDIKEIADFISKIDHKLSLGKPCYFPDLDIVMMPKKEDFSNLESYYSTYFHELSHWSGHSDRLNRDLTGNFGSASYGKEELIAELSAVFLSSEFNLTYNLENHASYLKSWLDSLRESPQFLKESIKEANKASNYLLEFK